MKIHKAQKDILYVSISSFILTIIWISFNIYHSYVTTTIEPTLQMQIEPIDPIFNLETIQQIKNRNRVEPIFEFKNSQVSSPEATVQPDTNNSPTSSESTILTEIDEIPEVDVQ